MKNGNISEEFKELFAFKNDEEEIEHEAHMLSFNFLSGLEKLKYKDSLKKKEIATKLKTSPSHITQLFRGDRLLSLMAIARIQKEYDITFVIKCIKNKTIKK